MEQHFMTSTLEEAYEDEYKYRTEYNETVIPKAKVSSGTINPIYINESTKLHSRDGMFNPVTNPSHYVEGRQYEPADVIEDWDLNFFLGNALKYIARANRKGNKAQDLAKAIWYLQRETGKK